jgi:hypothetical protein
VIILDIMPLLSITVLVYLYDCMVALASVVIVSKCRHYTFLLQSQYALFNVYVHILLFSFTERLSDALLVNSLQVSS